MTNAEKYLKEGVSIEEFAYAYAHVEQEALNGIHPCNIKHFLQQPVQPTLTEDERVILRNIPKEYTTIARNIVGALSARNNDDWIYADVFNHLFKFINNGEEYNIEELLK